MTTWPLYTHRSLPRHLPDRQWPTDNVVSDLDHLRRLGGVAR